MKVGYTPEDTTDSKAVKWESSNKEVATVDQNGKVTAIKDGTTTIKATVGKFTATCELTVQEVKLQGISLDKTSLELSKGQNSEALKVTYNPSNTTDDKTVTWTSSNENVATVKDGVVTAKATGETTITAKVGTFTATCKVSVNAKLTGITVTPAKATVEKGETKNLSVTYAPADTTDVKEVTWKSLNEDVATVDANGVVTAVAGGDATIVATAKANNEITAKCEVHVPVRIEKIELNKSEMTLDRKATEKLTVTFTPAETEDEEKVNWTSDDTTVATVDAEGNVTAIKAGEATITATTVDGKHTASCVVTVKERPLTAISLKDAQEEMLKGETCKLDVVLNPEDTTDDVTITYESLNKDVATVDAEGNVTALKAGDAEIKITATTQNGNKIEIVHTMTVNEIPLESIEIKSENDVTSFDAGTTIELKVVYNPTNTTDDKTVVWSSSDSEVATVKDGVVKGLKPGKVTITAKVGDKEATYELTVNEVPLKSITIKGDVTSLEEGKTTELKVVYNPTNTTDDKAVVWSSSDAKVATVDKNGVVTAVKAGKATITAKVGDKTAAYELTVTAKKPGDVPVKDNNTNNNGAVQTGDNNHIFGFIVVMLLSLAAIAGVVIFTRKRMHR